MTVGSILTHKKHGEMKVLEEDQNCVKVYPIDAGEERCFWIQKTDPLLSDKPAAKQFAGKKFKLPKVARRKPDEPDEPWRAYFCQHGNIWAHVLDVRFPRLAAIILDATGQVITPESKGVVIDADIKQRWGITFRIDFSLKPTDLPADIRVCQNIANGRFYICNNAFILDLLYNGMQFG